MRRECLRSKSHTKVSASIHHTPVCLKAIHVHAIHVHVFLNSRIFRGVKPIFRLCPSLGSSQPSPPKLDFGSALFLILLSGQVEVNPGPPMSGSLNLSSIFPCGYCEDPVTWEQRGICCDSCDMWFHKDCVDMGSFTFLAYSTTKSRGYAVDAIIQILIKIYSIRLKLKPLTLIILTI